MEDDHTTWSDKLPSIRFAMNTVVCSSTGFSPAYLTFGRNLRTPDDVEHDLRQIVQSDNFIADITPKLLLMANTLKRAKEVQEMKEEKRKEYVDKMRKPRPSYAVGDPVLVDTHALSKSSQGFSAKLAPRRDGPYIIKRRHGPSSYEIVNTDTNEVAGIYQASALRRFQADAGVPLPKPSAPKRKRGNAHGRMIYNNNSVTHNTTNSRCLTLFTHFE